MLPTSDCCRSHAIRIGSEMVEMSCGNASSLGSLLTSTWSIMRWSEWQDKCAENLTRESTKTMFCCRLLMPGGALSSLDYVSYAISHGICSLSLSPSLSHRLICYVVHFQACLSGFMLYWCSCIVRRPVSVEFCSFSSGHAALPSSSARRPEVLSPHRRI